MAGEQSRDSGRLWANGANIALHGSVTCGTAVMEGTASIEFGGVASTNVTFDAGARGTLKLADSFVFRGIVLGFNAYPANQCLSTAKIH